MKHALPILSLIVMVAGLVVVSRLVQKPQKISSQAFQPERTTLIMHLTQDPKTKKINFEKIEANDGYPMNNWENPNFKDRYTHEIQISDPSGKVFETRKFFFSDEIFYDTYSDKDKKMKGGVIKLDKAEAFITFPLPPGAKAKLRDIKAGKDIEIPLDKLADALANKKKVAKDIKIREIKPTP